MTKCLAAAFLMIFFAAVSAAQTPSLQLRVSPDCSRLLAPRWAYNQAMISQAVVGHGAAHLITPIEFVDALGFAPHTQSRIRAYAMSPHRRHWSAFLLLPDTASPKMKTLASTYADNPTRYLAFSQDDQWLAANLPQMSDQRPQHLVIMSHRSDIFTALHEVIHLEDFDAIYDYSTAKRSAYLLRMDVFTILSELHAYQEQFHMIRTENPAGADAAAEGVAMDIHSQVGRLSALLDEKTRSELQRIVGLSGQGLGDYYTYLVKGPHFRPWSEILPKLSSELFIEDRP